MSKKSLLSALDSELNTKTKPADFMHVIFAVGKLGLVFFDLVGTENVLKDAEPFGRELVLNNHFEFWPAVYGSKSEHLLTFVDEDLTNLREA